MSLNDVCLMVTGQKGFMEIPIFLLDLFMKLIKRTNSLCQPHYLQSSFVIKLMLVIYKEHKADDSIKEVLDVHYKQRILMGQVREDGR